MKQYQNKVIPCSMDRLLRNWQFNAKPHQERARELTLLSLIYFKIFRFPSYEDRVLKSITRGECDSFLKNKNNLLKDFKSMYLETQSRLKRKYPNNKSLLLSRRICKFDGNDSKPLWNSGFDPIDFSKKMQKKSENHVLISMDILNDWAVSASGAYGVIKLKKEILLEDIIYFNSADDFEGPLESDDYIVLNRNPKGIVKFSLKNISYDQDLINKMNNLDSSLKNHINVYEFSDTKSYLCPFNGIKGKSSLLKELYRTYLYWKNS